MDYKKLMGYSEKKKKVVKKQPKPKVNKVLESIREEFGLIKEVGAGPEYKPHIMKINKLYHAYWDAVQDFTDLLLKKGAKKEANNLHRAYMKLVHKFNSLFVKMIRKIM